MALPNLSGLSLKCADPCGGFSGGAPVPAPSIGVQQLQRVEFQDGRKDYYLYEDGEIEKARKVRSTWPTRGITVMYEGEKGQEQKVLVIYERGNLIIKEYYEGAKGQERKVQTRFNDGDVIVYEGDKGQERMVRRYLRKSTIVENFDGAKGQERKVRVVYQYPDTLELKFKEYYKGAKGQERKVRVRFNDGSVVEYEGAKDQERMVSQTIDGNYTKFEDEKGQERKVLVIMKDKAKVEYEGPKDQERIVRMTNPWGGYAELDGAKGQERIVREVAPPQARALKRELSSGETPPEAKR